MSTGAYDSACRDREASFNETLSKYHMEAAHDMADIVANKLPPYIWDIASKISNLVLTASWWYRPTVQFRAERFYGCDRGRSTEQSYYGPCVSSC